MHVQNGGNNTPESKMFTQKLLNIYFLAIQYSKLLAQLELIDYIAMQFQFRSM